MRRFDRLADNERKIRDANEEAELMARDEQEREGHRHRHEVEFHCACGRADCDETILMTVATYDEIHRLPHRFVIVPGHENPAIETIVSSYPTYSVVEKRPPFQADDAGAAGDEAAG